MPRLRIRHVIWPRRALILADTPRPDCWACGGEGGHNRDYGHPETGEYEGTNWEPCPCWDEQRRWTVLPLPRLPRLRRRTIPDPWATSDHSDEPPF
ncbi:hypothetical protein QWM81_05545 [Streptomyces ficellus]|uniref:Uncharacterized protein n=1 Tax=Streptomyces ficellus TaxID=1977088 RepID=A0ABT7Z1Z7_9ACTN|nr:hypothetical protein [Streptomyces ficellus]MDN3293512.1 hypothetical protein [Streptomyces ficellus]